MRRRKVTTITLDPEVLESAKEHDLNISKLSGDALRDAIRRREGGWLDMVLVIGEGMALGLILAVLATYVWMSLNGVYEVLISTNSHGEHYLELAMLCAVAALVAVDIVRRMHRLGEEQA